MGIKRLYSLCNCSTAAHIIQVEFYWEGGGFLDYYKIGQKIRKRRKAHGLSQEQLAERVNISVTHMSHIETGNTKLSLPVLTEIAVALGVRTDDLLYETSVVADSGAMEEIAAVLDRCTVQEAMVIADIVRAAKLSMDKYF